MTNIITPRLNPTILNGGGKQLVTTRPQIIEVLGDPVLISGEIYLYKAS